MAHQRKLPSNSDAPGGSTTTAKATILSRVQLGHSDLTLRTCVYPSYNINDRKGTPAVLFCSYIWQQDAQRISTLISSITDHAQKLKDELPLNALLINELARLQNNDNKGKELDYGKLCGSSRS